MPVPKINGPKKKAAPKNGFFSSENAPLIMGGVLGAAALLLYVSSRNSQQVSVGPALTLNPSTDADQSTVANLTAAIQAISNNRRNPPVTGSTPNPTPTNPSNPSGPGTGGSGGGGVTSPGPTNADWNNWLSTIFGNWTHNIPVGGSGGGGVGSSPPPSTTGPGSSNSPPPGVNQNTTPSLLGGFLSSSQFGINTLPSGLTYQKAVGNLQSAGLPLDLPSALTVADPNNMAQVQAIAGAYYAGNTTAAIRAINNTAIGQNAGNAATFNPNGTISIGAVTDKSGHSYAPVVYTPTGDYVTAGDLTAAVTGVPQADPNIGINAAVAANTAMYGNPSDPNFTGKPK